ncbi:MAG: DUF167 domain-containing protein [Patescibacteria group bacterium]
MRVFIKAKPNSKQNKVSKISENIFEVFVKEPPVDNKANEAIIKSLADYFGIPKSNIKIISGASSKQKIIEVVL